MQIAFAIATIILLALSSIIGSNSNQETDQRAARYAFSAGISCAVVVCVLAFSH